MVPLAIGLVVILSPSEKLREPRTNPVMEPSAFFRQRAMVGTPVGAFFVEDGLAGGKSSSGDALLVTRPKRDIVARETALEMASKADFEISSDADSSTAFTGLEGFLGVGLGVSGFFAAGVAFLAAAAFWAASLALAAASFLAMHPSPTDEQIDQAMSANLCRCGTYPRIRAAVKTASAKLQGAS